ncbi:MAG TPA: hypothetical protein VNS09_23290, partial [Solirubrobacter sp.]|nr:hypothetical protein [Solirubrobacter sp.]
SQQERRHLLQLTAPDDVKFDGSLVGRISALDADRRSFEFADRSGRRASGTFEQHGMFDELKRYMEREPNATIVRLACRYSTDNAGRLSKIEDVDDVEPVVATADPLAPELRRLLELSDGWHDGAGMGPTLMSVEWVRDFAAALDASELPELMVFPTLAGGVLVELQRRGTRWSVEVEPGGELFVAIVPADGNPEIVEAESVDDVINRLRALPA